MIKLIKGKVNERVWARGGFDRFELDGGDRRVFQGRRGRADASKIGTLKERRQPIEGH